jgi:hypothetical protein
LPGTAGSERAGDSGGWLMSATYERTERQSTAVTGFTYLAATLMLVSGVWAFFEGLAAVIKHQFYVVTPNYAYQIDVTAWGWIHLILAVVVVAAGICLFLGQTWARITGIVLAVLSSVANFLFIPYYPFWSIIIILMDIFIIWALIKPQESY